MPKSTLPTAPKESRGPKLNKDVIKKILSVFTIVFVLFVVPATVNVALTSQDIRNSAQVIDDKAAVDIKLPASTSSSSDIFWKIYPFVLGLIIIIWGALIIIYFGLKFRKKNY